ncbi:Protein of unknown function [Cotesia congregata]|uniref:Uncharacterized protein n=1 Tax=Cotesia congregata TaxID=51543 RepID=A0A8J2MJ60_COTCN|nr:Protein of unknown function [Cotesia congregata]
MEIEMASIGDLNDKNLFSSTIFNEWLVVLLFPEEGWARSASSSYWTLTPFWWSRSRCKVVEVAGTRRYTTQAKMVDTGTGTLYIIGSFKRQTVDPDFKMTHFAVIRRRDYEKAYEDPNPT